MIKKPKFMVLAVTSFMDMDEIQYSTRTTGTSRPPAELLNPTIRLTLMQCTHGVVSAVSVVGVRGKNSLWDGRKPVNVNWTR